MILAPAALLLLLPALQGEAQEGAPPPDFMRSKPPLPRKILEKKREGWYVTGIPLVGLDPELGPIVGAAVQLYDNGARSSPFFTYAPYRHQIQVGAQAGTRRNFSSAYLTYDEPYVEDTPWRIKAYLGYRVSNTENYFGTGEQTLGPLRYPGSPETFRRLDDFQQALRGTAGGITWNRYIDYERRQVVAAVNLEHDLLGGLLRPLAGLQFGHIGVTDFSGRTIDGAIEQETKLAEDDRLGRILGFDGGWDNSLRVGLAYDTRDYEPDPASGLLAQTFLSGSLRAMGSEFDYGQATFGLTGYAPLVPGYGRLVAVGNLIYSLRFGDVPFTAMNRLPLPKDETRSGLGGFKSLRGFSTSRFVGRTTAAAGAELRWAFSEFTLWNQHLKTALAPFVDAGRVYDRTGGLSLRDWEVSGGVGLRLAWNLATVISFDYGISSEGTLFFMELGHSF
jgi:outer membrane protein assembly factor BamA